MLNSSPDVAIVQARIIRNADMLKIIGERSVYEYELNLSGFVRSGNDML